MSRNFKDESGRFNFSSDLKTSLAIADIVMSVISDGSYRAPESDIKLPAGDYSLHRAGNNYIAAAFLGEGSGRAALEACDYCRLNFNDQQLALLLFAKAMGRGYKNAVDIFLKPDSWIYKSEHVELVSLMNSPIKIDLEDFKEISQAFYIKNEDYKGYPDFYPKESRKSNQDLMYNLLFCAFCNIPEATNKERIKKVEDFLKENADMGVTIAGFKKRLAEGAFAIGEASTFARELMFSPVVRGRDDPFLSPTPFSPACRMSSSSGRASSEIGGSLSPSFMPTLRLPDAAINNSSDQETASFYKLAPYEGDAAKGCAFK